MMWPMRSRRGGDPDRAARRRTVVLGMLLVLGAAALAASNAKRHFLQRSRLLNFEPVEATVVAIEVVAGGPLFLSSRTHQVDVQFDYEVAGERYRGTQFRPAPIHGSAGAMRDAVSGYSAGEVTRAWVDPMDPALAFLDRRLAYSPIGGFVFCACVLLAIALVRYRAAFAVTGWRGSLVFALVALAMWSVLTIDYLVLESPPYDPALWAYSAVHLLGCGLAAVGADRLMGRRGKGGAAAA